MIPGGVFRVPPQYSGTVNNNFVTRALTGNEQDKAITQIFDNYLG
jgi:capsid portal protein